MDSSPAESLAQQRITRIFRYLQAYNQIKNPVRLSVQEYDWSLWFHDLPEHPCIDAFHQSDDDPDDLVPDDLDKEPVLPDGDADLLLRVGRPEITSCPTPPEDLLPWLEPGWENPDAEAAIKPQRTSLLPDGVPVVTRFDSDETRSDRALLWQEQRRAWQITERPARAVMALFQRLYEVYGQLQREGERLELAIGEGILNWRTSANLHHPVLLQRLQLEFKPAVPEFVLRRTDQPVEFYTAMFQAVDGLDGRVIAHARQELDQLALTLPDDPGIPAFLGSLSTRLNALGKFVEGEPVGFEEYPRIGSAPVVFLRNRPTGYSTALESILTQIAQNPALPTSLHRIVGVADSEWDADSLPANLLVSGASPSDTSSGTPEILFSKAANEEQMQIAERLERHGCVLVQGPPGTGKTHTIANLVGHLLAQGKTILVTSYSAKALRVLRDQIVPPLQPLCVSVLESDSAGRSQLQTSVSTIVERLSGSSAETLEAEASHLKTRRETILRRLAQLEGEILDTRGNEYRAIVLEGREILPSDAARRVRDGVGKLDWIPTPTAPCAALPLTAAEISELYCSNLNITPQEERELDGRLPDLTALHSPEAWQSLLVESAECQAATEADIPALWTRVLSEGDIETLARISDSLTSGIGALQNAESWEWELVNAGQNPERVRLWESLFALVTEVESEAIRAERAVLEQNPVLHPEMPKAEQEHLLAEITAHLQRGGKINALTLLTKPNWRQFLNGATVKGRKPESPEAFAALLSLSRIEQQRADLARRWDLQVAKLGGPALAGTSGPPERFCRGYLPMLRSRLSWFAEVWQPLEKALSGLGFAWNPYWLRFPAGSVRRESAQDLASRVVPDLQALLLAHCAQIRLEQINAEGAKMVAVLDAFGSKSQSVATAGLRAAILVWDAETYRLAYLHMAELQSERMAYDRRLELLKRLEAVAPGWTQAIQERQPPHDAAQPPGDASRAWEWRQLADELARRDRQSPEALERQREQLGKELRFTTAELVERRAWAFQIRRTSLPQRQALMGWLNLVKKIGKGTGTRAARLQQEARLKMQDSRSAVPVWIMPMSRLVENFDPGTTRFDVVIIDEASQADAMGLIPLYMAKSVVIVGDNEQVSPDAVGDRLDTTQRLIDEHLSGIPNAILYDGQRSMYDIALESFGGHICLTEHFRCASEIIAFSNKLSYGGRIKPLRDMSASKLRPHVVPYRVHGGLSNKKVNERESETVAALLCAATEQPEYAGATFGVISLLGEEQARRIETLLRQWLLPAEYEERRIMCGMPPQFQGDERDVMFLSVVDGPTGGPLTMRADGANAMYKKRYNVAASRARDQMWVVYSVQPDVDLQPLDIRRALISHALDPMAAVKEFQGVEVKAESEFEREVIRRLIDRGYRVTPQWPVGRYRLDIVVDDGEKRLAIECDGDRYHPLEKLADDMARQAILERLGWTFARIRGSAFFRDPEEAMKPVFARLESLDIAPIGLSEPLPASEANHSDLTRRIIARAEALQREMTVGNEDVMPAVVVQEEMVLDLQDSALE
ncbi:MAG: Protein of unknown function (DUF559)/UvrD/REP helicase [Chthonomonadaceae bacterium]|nr:Protein of unknown function (DUF559)/UvrD/REP helicase [Chthonomonadaceae bacterium]